MRNHFSHIGLCLIGLFSLLTLGCTSIPKESDFNIRVIDAETKRPLPDAKVQLSEAQRNDVARELTEVTEKNGFAHFRELPGADDCVLSVSAGHYMPEVTTVYEATQASSSTSAADAVLTAKKRVVQVELFAEPRPTIELVVPAGFRGLIQADVSIDPTQLSSSQMRRFRYEVDPQGHANVNGPPILRTILPTDFVAIFPDGTPIPEAKQQFDLGLRIVAKTDTTNYFVYGTELECQEAKKKLRNVLESRGGSISGKKGGGGGRLGAGNH